MATGTVNGSMQRRASGSFNQTAAAPTFFVHISAVERVGMRT
jgi:cold shock CspA family protein